MKGEKSGSGVNKGSYFCTCLGLFTDFQYSIFFN